MNDWGGFPYFWKHPFVETCPSKSSACRWQRLRPKSSWPQRCKASWKTEERPGFSATLPKTNSSPLKIGHPKRKLRFQPSIFRCELLVSGRVIFLREANFRLNKVENGDHLSTAPLDAFVKVQRHLLSSISCFWIWRSCGIAEPLVEQEWCCWMWQPFNRNTGSQLICIDLPWFALPLLAHAIVSHCRRCRF